MAFARRLAWLWAGCSGLAACQFVSGVNDLEVVESGGSGGTGGSGGASGGTGGSSTSSGGTSTTGNDCGVPSGWECDPVDNCGCEDGEGCGYDTSEGSALCQQPGSNDPYSGCIDNLDCPVGYGCIGSVCKKYCRSAADCDWDNAACLEVYDDAGVIEGFGFCSAECDLIDPTAQTDDSHACGEGATCYPTVDDSGSFEHALCVGTESEAQQDAACVDASGERDFLACGPGYFCSSLGDSCQQWCDVDDALCPRGAECIGFDPPLVVQGTELGSCYTCARGDNECSLAPACGCAGTEV